MTGYQQSQSNSYYSPTAHATSIFSPEPGLASFGQYGDVGKAMTCFQRSGLGLSSSSCREGFSFLEFTFEEAADFVEITTIRTSEPAGLIAFGTDGQVLASCATLNSYGTQAGRCSGYNFSGDGNYYSLSIGMDSRAISRIWYGGVLGAGVQASAISYNVPEPSTLLLMSGGLFALLWMRRGSAGSMRTQAVTAN
ncbi:MAG: PEP-CTERM sorting domain-containing protein [Candidatus Obscuribacterales bacterium]|nr:PEP-CTERM sorting domain-containing protein [Steroidobacteraceae bacterium]